MIHILSDAVQRDLFTHGDQFSVDTGAVSILALMCVHISDPVFLVEPILLSLQRLKDHILSAVTSDGLIGNLYSTGLGVQALSVIGHIVPEGSWNCSLSLKRLLDDPSALANPQAASQVTPSLEGRTYLDVGRMDCRRDFSNLTLLEPSEPTPTEVEMPLITVSYNITDGVGGTFSYAIPISVPKGSSLLSVMEKARESRPLNFSFQLKTSLWGAYVTSIRGLRSSSKNRTYWQLLSGDRALEQGIEDYKPSDGEKIIIILSHY
ncbi:transcobalamin-1-like [Narcine bancroftii]|uniref:transcobalamin-1-like n=1 Tax=Narcine bancroftii TaxID=1343680 RepID=UPI0038321B97